MVARFCIRRFECLRFHLSSIEGNPISQTGFNGKIALLVNVAAAAAPLRSAIEKLL